MQIVSVWQVPGLKKIALTGASNSFFIPMEIKNNHKTIRWEAENKTQLKEETFLSPSMQCKHPHWAQEKEKQPVTEYWQMKNT